ncbi:PREDICTED: LRR receptor-like serine/threonine-protein kinase EFR [Populus euphratica]|uniref:LRR receptor-like serine/threonine-protein kinase EFR n=1 Tax=Populus euphratica TaxID=75702 RepID=A0AAJ6T1C3_POPEU|nr:PREDICTED: LRR receptor-like serine/threonine-protein kinase EFR [Populus euphratica]
MSSCILWLLFLQVTVLSFSITLHGGNETDKLSLIAFRAQVPFGRMNSWNESVHFCEWPGVTCGRLHQRVVELDLHYRLMLNLGSTLLISGEIPVNISSCSNLLNLDLERNNLTGKLPALLRISEASPEVSGQLSSDQTSSVGLKGTIGYAEPDLAAVIGLILKLIGRSGLNGLRSGVSRCTE